MTRALQRQIEQEVTAVVPEDRHVAVLALMDQDRNVTLGVATRFGRRSRWHLSAEAQREWSTKAVTGQVRLIGSW